MTPTAQQVIEAKELLAKIRAEYAANDTGFAGSHVARAGFVLLDWIEHLERKLAAPQTNGDHFDGSHG